MRLILSRRLHCRFSQGLNKYVIDSRIGGSSAEGLYEIYAGKYENKDLKKVKQKNKAYGVSIINTPEQCKKCVQILKSVENIVAWDTETIDLDIKNESPVGRGKIICASFFAGPEYNFGNGPKVFIDNFGTNAGLINYFKEYLESEKYKKVWHNYGFDRHVFYNHDINVRGFGGDTMQMARLYDPSKMFGAYSLSALSKEYKEGLQKIVQIYTKNKIKLYNSMLSQQDSQNKNLELDIQQKLKNLQKYKQISSLSNSTLLKTKMTQIFGRKKQLQAGEQGKTFEYPTTLTMHTQSQHITKWITYSVLDSEVTFFLRQALQLVLKNQKLKQYKGINNSFEIYQRYWRPLGELLTDMERQGFKINIDHMKQIQRQATNKIQQKKLVFMDFLFTFQNDKNLHLFNPSSSAHMIQLLHAPFQVEPQKVKQKQTKQQIDYEMQSLINTAEQQKQNSRIVKRTIISSLPEVKQFRVQNKDPKIGGSFVPMKIKGLGIPAVDMTPTGIPSLDFQSIKKLAGSPKQQKYGTAYTFFKEKGQEQFGKKLCEALQSLIDMRHTETLLQTFIQPLQTFCDKNNRIHCSLNVNTQTGRLSSRKPNLQNQPALEKDVYKIRSAFTCEKGNKLIVADYGQLQLRVLAHMSKCKTMIDAFEQGGDFHSRTAISMYDYIKKDIEEGKVLLEWDKNKGPAPVPLLKDKYASERRKAKTVNFSIAYGKTAKGFAQDWKCTQKQAKQVIKNWFADRKEVQQWQKLKQKIAKDDKLTQTLLGRHRRLNNFFQGKATSLYGMGLRRAINTPIQGGAADIVIASMVKIHKNQRLRQLKWKLLLQVHDELILQGPQQHVKQAYEIVKDAMCHPFQEDLLVQLEIDAKIGNTWYECK